jgi:electron transfer flavoprotein alpha subunit
MDFSYLDDWTDEEPIAEIKGPGEGYRDFFVLVETEGDAIHPASLEAMGQARELADQIGVYVIALLLGEAAQALGQGLFPYGADSVLTGDSPDLAEYQPHRYTQAVASLVEQYRPEILLMPATRLGNDLAPRLAQRLDTGLMSHCIRLEMDMSERLLLGTFPVLGGEMYHTAACPKARPQMATLEPGAFARPYPDESRSGQVQVVEVDAATSLPGLAWESMDASIELPATPLAKARIVVAGGRGMAGSSGYDLVKQLAGALGAAAAGSRGAFDEGWIGEEQIVGVGGVTIAPDLYIACGLSGDIYHTYGLQGARFVLAINTDEQAPIMTRANLALVGDAREVIPAMLQALG